MSYVVAATWTAKEGQEDTIARVIENMVEPSRAETGVLLYLAHRAVDNPRVFFLYEQYIDADAYEAHTQTPHFDRWVRGEAFANLESRERGFYATMS
jgi:(4S)-4-hydroxy-5-phosphonooxypentane-2,3-dione isomerase